MDISLNFGSLENMKTTYSEPKGYLGRSGKGLIVYLGLNTIRRSKEIKRERFDITNVSIKDISKIIKEFEDFSYEGYFRTRSKHMPADSYLCLARHLAKCMMRLNMRVGPVRMQMTNTQKMNNSEMST